MSFWEEEIARQDALEKEFNEQFAYLIDYANENPDATTEDFLNKLMEEGKLA